MACHEENLGTLREMLPAPLLGDVPFLPQWQAVEMQRYIDIQLLLTIEKLAELEDALQLEKFIAYLVQI